MMTLALWPTVTIRRNGFIGYALASGLHSHWWRCANLSSRSFYLRAKCNCLFTKCTHHSKSPHLCGYRQSIARSVRLLSYYLVLSLELRARSWQYFPRWKPAEQWLLVIFPIVQISRRDPSYPSFQVLWWVPGGTSTHSKLIPRLGVWCWIVVAVATGDSHSARDNTSPWGCLTHNQSFRWSPLRQLWIPVHRHIWDVHSPSELSPWTLIPWYIQNCMACSCSLDIYVLLRLLRLKNSRIIISNASFRLKRPGVPDGSDGSDRTSYTLTENYTHPIAQATGRLAYLPPLGCTWYTHHQNDTCVTLFTGLQLCCSRLHNAWWCLCLSSADSHIVPLSYIECRTRPIHVWLWDFVIYCNTVFASDTLLAVTFASPLSYFTSLKYTVKFSHSIVLCP